MFKKDKNEISFYEVGLVLIVIGAAALVIGAVEWLANIYGMAGGFSSPFTKIIGGTIVIALGYIQLELELIRKQ